MSTIKRADQVDCIRRVFGARVDVSGEGHLTIDGVDVEEDLDPELTAEFDREVGHVVDRIIFGVGGDPWSPTLPASLLVLRDQQEEDRRYDANLAVEIDREFQAAGADNEIYHHVYRVARQHRADPSEAAAIAARVQESGCTRAEGIMKTLATTGALTGICSAKDLLGE